jgi:hypothetical protein
MQMVKMYELIGIGFLVASHILIIATFTVAWLNGNQVIVYINQYNEAFTEGIMLLISIPFVVYASARAVWRYLYDKA